MHGISAGRLLQLFMLSLHHQNSSAERVTAGWVLGNMLPFFYILKVLNFLRVPAEEETLGLDESYHGAQPLANLLHPCIGL